MAPKHGGGATIKGKQAPVHEGQFLQFLRSVGYKDELPPSTVAWLESAPLFKFLATKLSHDNFVTPEEQQEYNELMLAHGPDSSLYDAVAGFGSDVDSESFAASTQDQKEIDAFLAGLSDEEVSRMLEAEEAYTQQLEQQLAAVHTASDALASTTKQQAEAQGPTNFSLTATAASDLSAAKVEAQRLSESFDETLCDLETVCRELCSLAGQPQLWLLCAADQAGYKHMDDHINAQHLRGVQVLDVCDVALDLHHPTSPTAVNPLALAAAAAAAKASGPQTLVAAAGAGAGVSSPRGGQQQQGMTPRQHVHGHSLADALAEARTKRRAAHAERNVALTREMSRQQHAFLLAYQRDVAAGLKEQGLRAELAAVQQIRSQSGEFAALLGKGPSAIQELQQQVKDAGAAMMLLKHTSLKHLIREVADLNDCHIVVGDYDRHLTKVNYAMDRKRAMLDSLISRASLHLVLLLLCMEELRRLSVLSGQLQGTANILEGYIAATEARMHRCSAALDALNQAQGLSNVQSGDSYLCALMAAADGTLALPKQQEQQRGASEPGKEPLTPRDAQMAHGSATGGMFTPSFAPTSSLVEKLQGLSDNLDSSTEQLNKLLDLLPAQMDQHKASAVRLHRTAFPPGQPMHVAGSSGAGIPGWVAGAGSSVAGSMRTASVAGSARGGGSAAASLRSEGSLSGLTQLQHPQLLLTLAELAEADAAVSGCYAQLSGDSNLAVKKQNEYVQKLKRCKELSLEGEIMAKFFNEPEKLEAEVEAIKEQLQQMRLGALLSW